MRTHRHKPIIRRSVTFSAAVIAVLMALAAAGCGRTDDELTVTRPVPDGELSDPADADDLDPREDGNDTDDGEAPELPALPDSALAYADAVVAAWTIGDLDVLFALTTPLVGEQLIQIPGPPSMAWTWIRCEQDAVCSYYNDDGDHLTLLIAPELRGQPHGAIDVTFAGTIYPDDSLDYVEEFVGAWQTGNLARMHQLALPEVVDAYLLFEPAPLIDHGYAGGGGGLAIVKVLVEGAEIDTHVGTTLLGGPQAIRGAFPEI